MKVKDCPYCTDRMYIYLRQERWICADHARCGYTLDATSEEVNAAYTYNKAVRERISRSINNDRPPVAI